MVNLFALIHKEFKGIWLAVPAAGFLGCTGAVVALALDLAAQRPADLKAIAEIAGLLLLVRLVFMATHRGFQRRAVQLDPKSDKRPQDPPR